MKETEQESAKEELTESELRDEQPPEPEDQEETESSEEVEVEAKDQEESDSPDDKEDESEEDEGFRVEEVFNQVLGMHLERLMGSRYGIGGLPINVLTLSCFILLTDQATMEETTDATEKFTEDTLVAELMDLGLDVDDDTFEVIEDMIDAGYIEDDEEGFYTPLKPAIKITEQLDTIFPGMPGINLVAYFIQIMDEVESERKDLEYAISQFDQTLRRQAVADKTEKEKKTKKTVKGAQPTQTDWQAISEEVRTRLTEEVRTRQDKGAKLSDLYSPLPAPKPKPAAPQTPIKVDAPPTEPISDQTEAEPTELSDPGVPEDQLHEASEASAAAGEESTEAPEAMEPVLDESEAHAGDTVSPAEGAETAETDQPQQSDEGITSEEEQDEPAADQVDEPVEFDDEDLEKEIGAFEEELGSECPICKKGNVQPQTTTRGKLFYKCGNKSCNFISWGKPFHIQCPHCQNPFLVEGADMDGVPVLKCPRATCRYWQTVDGQQTYNTQEAAVAAAGSSGASPAMEKPAKKSRKKRVVRRRLVRRKR